MRMTNAMQAALYWNRKHRGPKVLETGMSTAVVAPPAAGTARLNNAAPASATMLWINYTGALGNLKDPIFQSIVPGSIITIQSRSNGGYAQYKAAAPVDNSTYAAVPLTYIGGTLSFIDADRMFIGVGSTA